MKGDILTPCANTISISLEVSHTRLKVVRVIICLIVCLAARALEKQQQDMLIVWAYESIYIRSRNDSPLGVIQIVVSSVPASRSNRCLCRPTP